MKTRDSKKPSTMLICLLLVSAFLGEQILQVSTEASGAVLTGVIYDQGVDTDGNDAYDYLELGVEINVTDAGDYNIQAFGLMDDNYGYIDVGDSQLAYLEIGVQVVYLSLEGATIYGSGLNATKVAGLSLFDGEFNLLGELYETPLSRIYAYTEFDTPGAILTGEIVDRGVDTDGDGLFEYLEVGVEVQVTESRIYHIDVGGLRDPFYNYIDVWNYTEAYLDAGLAYLNISFAGMRIYLSGVNASYISSIELRDEEMNTIGSLSDGALSREYSYNEFETPNASLTGVIYDQGVDTDGNDAYDYLELGVEINVTDAGDYNIQAFGLMDDNYGYIDVGDSQLAYLEIGVQVVYLSLEGATIYGSGLNPISVSSVSLYDADYEPLGELNEVPLSRRYFYSEFDMPIPLSVGVEAGDWVKYNVTADWQTSDPSSTEPSQIEEFREIEWVKFEIQNVSTTYITILQTYRFKNGTDQSAPPMSGDIATQFITFVIPSNLGEGDVIPGTAAPINSTRSRSYAGANRTVNYLGYSGSFLDMNMTQTMYWDKATGILCEMFMETSMAIDNYLTSTSTSFVIIETNLWKIETELSCSVSKNTLTKGDSIVGAGSISAALTGKTVTLTYRRPDGSTLNRTVTTGSDGSYSDSYTPDATGSWSVTASWEGDSMYNSAISSSQSFVVTSVPLIETPLGMAMVGGGIVIVVIAIILVRRKRKNESR